MNSRPVIIDCHSLPIFGVAPIGNDQVGDQLKLDLDWLQHPKYVHVQDSVLDLLKQKEKQYQFRKIGNVLFLCGGLNSLRREKLAEYFRQNHPQLLIFYAEAVWAIIAHYNPSANALEVEAQLAQLADAVIVIVESPGTYAELGAFANSDTLKKKVLPILDEAHAHIAIEKKSFLQTGPVIWIDKESLFAPKHLDSL